MVAHCPPLRHLYSRFVTLTTCNAAKIRLSVRLIDLWDTRAACLPVQEEAGPARSFILLQIPRKSLNTLLTPSSMR